MPTRGGVDMTITTTTGQKTTPRSLRQLMKRKKEKIECCDICKVDIRENKQKNKKKTNSTFP